MIDVKELRIGNLVEIETTINGRSLRSVERVIGLLDNTIFFDMNDVNGKRSVEYCIPVPLTEEILLKCGFKKINHIGGYSFWSYDKNKVNFYCDIYDRYTRVGGYSIPNHIIYVHQLQNLYFTLTGKELEITL